VNLPTVTDGVIVVGAGPVGCTVAILLADQGIWLAQRYCRLVT
jgi:flavin-dependent dehydrogenase